jgi:histidyl-tRNA synthetase
MYRVTAKSSAEKSNEFILRPEGTAGTVRAMLQNGMLNDALPQKVFYFVSCFRHERPQAGRLREFHQFGVEMAGASSPVADAEVIALANEVIYTLGIIDVKLYINSIGCPICRGEYQKKLREYFEPFLGTLCGTCQERFEKNPMRLLDCKSPVCKDIAKDAPVILDSLCDECKNHFEELKKHLGTMQIEYTVNPKIVRGLDYYTKTVFEFVSENIGSQGTVCGGGRYDGLIEELGGKHTPALGFAMGLERLIMVLENQKIEFPKAHAPQVYIASLGENAIEKTIELTTRLRQSGHFAECDLMGRSFNAQMKYANKIAAEYILIIGDNELETGKATLKSTAFDKVIEYEISIAGTFVFDFEKCTAANLTMFNDLAHTLGLNFDDVQNMIGYLNDKKQ